MSSVSIELIGFEDLDNILSLFLGWIGISILMHAFPSVVDGKGLVDSILKNKEVNILIKIITAPVIVFRCFRFCNMVGLILCNRSIYGITKNISKFHLI